MGKRRKNRAVRPSSTEELLTEHVSKLLGAGSITPMMVYDLLLMGHRVYRQGFGLPHEIVWKSILDAFMDHDRYYLTPGQIAILHGRTKPATEDMAELSS
jgi:hypothetical protein